MTYMTLVVDDTCYLAAPTALGAPPSAALEAMLLRTRTMWCSVLGPARVRSSGALLKE